MLLWEGKKPVVLLLGEVILAHAEWNDLEALAELRVSRVLKTLLVARALTKGRCSKSMREPDISFWPIVKRVSMTGW